LILVTRKIQFSLGLAMCLLAVGSLQRAVAQQKDSAQTKPDDTTKYKTINPYRPSFRPSDRYGDPFSNYSTASPLYLKNPKSLNLDTQIDTGMNYSIREKIGNVNFRPNSSMSFDEFSLHHDQEFRKKYWKTKSLALDGESAVSGRNLLPKIYISPILDRIFGGSYVELIPRGNVGLDFGASFQTVNNPNISIRQQTNGNFEFDQQISLNVTGKVGEKLKVTTNFDNNNSFDFQNIMKVEYTGFKEDLLKKLEIGNVSLPLNNTLIQGAQNLFGVKAQLQFGKLSVTAIASTQRGKQSSIRVGGSANGTAQGRQFEIRGSSYDENRHFFLGQFFRDNFEKWMGTLPQPLSGINITRIEVYSINRSNDTQTNRDVVAFMDMGETDKNLYREALSNNRPLGPTSNNANKLFDYLKTISAESDNINELLATGNFTNGTDFEKITSARKLAATEFSFHAQLGYLTLQRKLQNDEALAVAFEYTYNGVAYKVGELTEDYSNKPPKEVVYLKMLRPRKIAVKDPLNKILPTWNLMMKNIYSLNVSSLSRDGFQLRMVYKNDATGLDIPNLQDGVVTSTKQLIQVFGLDRLNPYNDPQPDGNFDFVEGVTVNTTNGLIIFPFLEPFNKPLLDLFGLEKNPALESTLRAKYLYDTLYRTTQAEAALLSTKNKFYITGSFKAGSGKEISIQGFNISPGSVKVFAGGTPLREGVDFSVDYTFGKVTILNEGILSSGKDLEITYEQQDPFAFQTRSLLGTRFDYKLNDDVNIGATFLYYNERPLISRNLIGSEPARNIQYGLDFNMKKNSRVLTKLVDALPFLQTKEVSTITINAEFAQLLPGTSNVIDGEGTSFIDDFENTITPYSLIAPQAWKLSSVPKEFDETGGAINNIAAGFKRAKLAWYQVDNLFYRESGSFKPPNISVEDLKNHYTRPVVPQEIFPGRDAFVGNFYEPILDLAYYPGERGPYNYNPSFDASGKSNWAGITTAIRNEVDFDKANVEYLEFWLLDPYINTENGKVIVEKGNEKSNTTGGKMVLHLGSISEDVTHDGKHGFENGLPREASSADVTPTPWGNVTNKQFLNNAFDSDPNSRANQDVGMDGLKNDGEKNKFPATANLNDPSSDDFKYFLGGDYDGRDAKILERYKNINGQDGNSPIVTAGQSFAQSGSPLPDNEDLNQDNTLSDLDEYYSYSIDLGIGKLAVGNKFIVDKITPVTLNGQPNSDQATWYLFRVPIRDFDPKATVGKITGFKSIRYARMLVTGFSEPVVLRFANFRMIGNRWRKYDQSLEAPGFSKKNEDIDLSKFTVSAVNVEDNGQPDAKKPGYVEPLKRDRDVTSVQQRRLNEQSLQLCVTDLDDGDARAIYKNVTLDFFNYGRIKMFLSANDQNLVTQDNQATGFLRLGTDFDQNYYEIELPLKITGPDTREGDKVWPIENQIDLDLNELYALKVQRDREGFPLASSYPQGGPKQIGKHGIRVVGRPDLAQVTLMMIGVRNPRTPDAKKLNLCIWADELRLTEFDQTAGWAGNVVVNAKLADLGNVTGSYKHIGFGYGGVQSKIAERARGETNAFDISGTINIDKLLPSKLGLKIPMFFSYESNVISPNFDPANPDVRLAAGLKSFDTDAQRNAYVDLIQDRTTRRSLNFTNVRKVKVKKDAKTHIYDIENFSFTYAYSEQTHTNFSLVTDTRRSIKGAVAWQYNSKFKGFEPFKDVKLFSSKHLQFLKDFNFNPMPTSISVRADLDRSYSELTYRSSPKDANPALNKPNYQKFFVFNRYYNARWSLTKSLTLDYNATVNAIIDEPIGDLSQQDSLNVVIKNLKNFGRMKAFDQSITANYTLPFEKFPITNWINADYRYSAGYNWKAGPLEKVDSLKLGNIIQNNRTQAITSKIDMVKFYNKIGFLKGINSPAKPPPPVDKSKPAKPDTVRRPPDLKAAKLLLRLIMSLRSVSGTYTLTEGTILPGFTKTPRLFGLDENWSSPGYGFIFGEQDPDIASNAARNGWLTKNINLTAPFAQTQTSEINLKANLEPSSDFKIQLDARKTSTTSFQEIFRYDSTGQKNRSIEEQYIFQGISPNRSGSYRISFLSINTAFANNGSISSDVFKQFEKNLAIIKQRFEKLDVNQGKEYDRKSQDVLIPAFIAAYSGTSADKVSLSPFPSIPIPNWRIDYNGLNKISFFKDIFQSVTMNHAYVSNYSVVNYSNSLLYKSNVGLGNSIESYNSGIDFANQKSVTSDSALLIPKYIINQVLISESFQPLVGISFRTKSKLNVKFEYKTKRDLSLQVSNAQLTEMNTKDWSFEIGFTKNNMKLPFKDQGRTITLKNDVTFLLNVSMSNTQTFQRKIGDGQIDGESIVTNGNINFQFKPNIRYVVNQKLTLQLYADHSTNEPLITSSFPRTNTKVGFKLLFNLAP
jgi:cell surface protein SprA